MVELLVVIAIIGVLAGIAIPSYRSHSDKAKKTVSETILKQVHEFVGLRRIQLPPKEVNETDLGDKVGSGLSASNFFIVSSSTSTRKITTDTWCVEFKDSKLTSGKVSCIDSNGKMEHSDSDTSFTAIGSGKTDCKTSGNTKGNCG